MPFPWLALASIGSALAPLILGGGKEQTQTQTTTAEAPPKGYQSPMLPVADPMILNMLLKNMSAWGGPAGPKGTTGSFYSPGMMGDMMSLIGREWPELMKGTASTEMGTGRGPSIPSPGGRQ